MAFDLEAQQRCSSWISKVEYALRSNPEHVPKCQEFYIAKMPDFFHLSSAAYAPRQWRFGLHNREELNTSGSEAMKLSFASALGLVGQKWKDFCEIVVSDECLLDIKQCYGLREEETILTDEVIRYIMTLDALCLVVYMEIWKFSLGERLVWTKGNVTENHEIMFPTPKTGFVILSVLDYDICKIENQVPFGLIIHVVERFTQTQASAPASCEDINSNGSNESYGGYMRKLIRRGVELGVSQFMDVSGTSFKTPQSLNSPPSTWKTHFLATAYEMICGDEGLKRRSDYSFGGSYLHIPSATKLRCSGITIEGIAGPLEKLSYKDGRLFLPKMKMFDDSLGIARNIAMYEYTRQKGHCIFVDYILLMRDLIQTPMDFEILVECDVFHCGVQTAIAVDNWRQVGKGLIMSPSSKEHHDMKESIVQRCKLRRHKLWDAFQIEFCSKPWVVISVFTVTVVSVATLIQTYVGVIGSNRMKPHFP